MNTIQSLRSCLVLAAGATLLLTSCGTGSTQEAAGSVADMAPIVLTLADGNVENSVGGDALHVLMDEIEEKTDGMVQFEAHWGGSLSTGDNMLGDVGAGAVDIGHIIPTYFPQELPLSNWLEGASSNISRSYPYGLLQGMVTSQEFTVSDQEMLAEYEGQNVVPLLGYAAGPRDLMCTSPVETLADARGKLKRVTGEVLTRETEAIGMAPVNMPSSDLYDGLQRGVVDCASNPPPYLSAFSIWEPASYYMPLQMSQGHGLTFGINKDVWDGFPEDLKQIFREASHSAWVFLIEETFNEYKRFVEEGESDHGVTFVDSSEVSAQLTSHQEASRASLTGRAPDGIGDPEALLERYYATQSEWLGRFEAELPFPDEEVGMEDLKKRYLDSADLDMTSISSLTSELFIADGP